MATEPRLLPLPLTRVRTPFDRSPAGGRRTRRCAFIAIAALLLACDDSATDPSRSAGLPIAFSIDLAGGAAAAFDAADAIRIIVVADDVIVHDEVLPFSSNGGDVRIRLPVDSDLEGAAVGVSVELRRGQAALFSGSGTVIASSRSTDPADIVLDPVVAAIVPQTDLLIPLIGGTLQLDAVPVFATGDTITTVSVTYQLLDQGIIRLQSGDVAVGEAEGTARVRATAGGRTADFAVEVRIIAATVTVEPPSALMGISGTLRLVARVFDGAGNSISRQPTWSSDNTSVATVSSAGVVTALAAGNAAITATVDAAQGSSQIEVSTAVRPAEPTGLAAASTGNAVNLSWQDNATNETGYEVRRGPVGGTVVAIATLQANASSYSDTNLPGDMVWDYVAAACNQQICAESDRATGYTTPLAPTGLTVLQNDPDTRMFRLGWTDASAAETGFRVEMLVPGTGQFQPVATLPAGTTAYDGVGEPSSTETYRIAACNPAGCAVSGTVMLTFAAAAPQAITLPTITSTELVGSTDGYGRVHDWWFEWYYDPSFIDANVTSPVSTTSSGFHVVPLFDLGSKEPIYYRMVAMNASGTTYGATQSFIAPELEALAASPDTVCNAISGCSHPQTITFTAISTGPVYTYPNPFQVVSFGLEIAFPAVELGSGSVSVIDDPIDGTRAWIYSITINAPTDSLFLSLSQGSYSVAVRGFPGSASGNVVSSSIPFVVSKF